MSTLAAAALDMQVDLDRWSLRAVLHADATPAHDLVIATLDVQR